MLSLFDTWDLGFFFAYRKVYAEEVEGVRARASAFRFPEEILHNRDWAWMNEYILRSKAAGWFLHSLFW